MKKTNTKKLAIILSIVIIIIIIVIVGVLFALPGFDTSSSERENAMLTAGTDYYNKHMTGVTGVDEAIVTMEMLEKRMKQDTSEVYDLSALDRCENDTSVTFTIEDGKIVDSKVELNCK